MKRLVTTIVIAFSIAGVAVAHDPATIVKSLVIAAHTEDAYFTVWETQPHVKPVKIPRVHDDALIYTLDATMVSCPDDYGPVAAWHEISGAWPTRDVIYGADAFVEEGEVRISLRARQNHRGYFYVEVYVMCASLKKDSNPGEKVEPVG